MQLPNDFVIQMHKLISDYSTFEKALDKSPKRAFWVNTHKIKVDDWDSINPYSSHKILSRAGSYYLDKDKIGLHPYFLAGLVYSQDPSAQMVCSYLPDLKDKLVIDVCASPGGKTCMLASSAGLVISNEYVNKRVSILKSNVERLGFDNVCITNMDSKLLAEKFRQSSYLTLVDAPCSGEGMFRKDPNTVLEWSLSGVESNARRQQEILSNASRTVAKGGYLLYSTCTYLLTENEAVIVEFLKSHSDFHILPIDKNVQEVSQAGLVIDKDYPTDLARRFFIQDDFGEGQFMCLMRRDGEYEDGDLKDFNFAKLTREEEKITKEFLSHNTSLNNYKLQKIGSFINILPNISYPINENGVATCGVVVGQVDKGRFIPHHNLATAFGYNMNNVVKLSLDDTRLKKYLMGEQIESDIPNGYCCVMLDSYPLGLGKATNGKINNLYPKGLRTVIKNK